MLTPQIILHGKKSLAGGLATFPVAHLKHPELTEQGNWQPKQSTRNIFSRKWDQMEVEVGVWQRKEDHKGRGRREAFLPALRRQAPWGGDYMTGRSCCSAWDPQLQETYTILSLRAYRITLLLA